MVFVIGITGRICSGKSTLSKTLIKRKIPVIDCDKLGHELYQKGSIVYNDFIKLFGKEVVGVDGSIDRKKLSELVFSNPQNVKIISDLTWPAIYTLLQERIKVLEKEGHPIVGVEAALLIRANWSIVNVIWETRIDEAETIKRLKTRNGLSEEQAKKRIQSQPTQEEYDNKSQVQINTMGTIEETATLINKEVDKLLEQLKITLN
ncbi:dephospho-CoA kinase, putative [Entamoeba histolytica HM-1:IMSS-B]|uniref:Dephospho-CoA kinase, putative n=6 Tax=Entamoeba histolytica TaxID=5759 RepID=C4LWC7_ENTH1|nr:dephospho-CoA kinase, putative [Entamoeba histolytica HM-1:IMSS]EMD46667.1 dephospho CoA kinase, putative [Entamoeba histolytica KU27]EMH78284.1 dephospho-CoA kinase, putative [Entamoeba histolytica HM-1:IMSS-B]EMS14479.1 dephospho-CoA kinase [Entamoeba histolytica HM-3:IMSS]ENY64048.1 dephospho-CoA kinase, putative [Entamoeba histolytica HM-1:IMSS-A]GAT93010.1 dephospho-coa kinase putative [Entamoeba histolytica]|eukprot:XP_655761.1 dephospho-CoA kinase, putative [Entamoeba histolytica HM-1:IMSS]